MTISRLLMARAKPQNLVLLGQDYPNSSLLAEQNYRSTSRILRAANILIANNPHVYEKSLFSEIPDGEKLKVLLAKDEEQRQSGLQELIAHKFLNRTEYRDYDSLSG